MSVASPVLVNMSAVLGLVVSLTYCLGDSESLILSSRVTSMSWQQWTTFLGQLQSTFPFTMTVLIFSRPFAVRAAGLHHPDQVAAACLP